MKPLCEKRDIYHEVKALLMEWYADEARQVESSGLGSCFYWAHCGWKVLRDHGFNDVLFQAGSMHWPFVPQSEWLTAPETHFGFEWSPDTSASVEAVRIGKMPEIHVWLALPNRNELVDFSTSGFPAQAEADGKRKWTGARPPDFLWCGQLPVGVFYRPNLEAIQYLFKRIAKDYDQSNHARVDLCQQQRSR